MARPFIFGAILFHLLSCCIPRWTLAQDLSANVAKLSVLENATAGTIITPDVRILLGSPPLHQVRLGPGTLLGFVELDKLSGQLTLKKTLDLESTSLCEADKSCCRVTLDNQVLPALDSFTRFSGLSSDRLGSACTLSAYVLGSLSGSNSATPLGNIHLQVQDVNDQPPRFLSGQALITNPLVITIPEASSDIAPIELPLATDLDFSPAFRVNSYKLEFDDHAFNLQNQGPFHFDGSSEVQIRNLDPFRLVYNPRKPSLHLELTSALDREKTPEYNLRLLAEDGSNSQAVLKILVKVADVNEFTPEFETDGDPRSRKLQFEETLEAGTELARFKAVDKDAPPNDRIEYRIGSSSPSNVAETIFQLDSKTGSLLLRRQLDYETVQRFKLQILALDNVGQAESALRKTATLDVDIEVLDTNDNKPEIMLENATPGGKYAEVWMKENLAEGYTVTYFTATDRDVGENGNVNCKLLNWTDEFRLMNFDKLTAIQTKKKLDRETQDRYPLTIECQDGGKPPQASQKNLLIRVSDENDEKPLFGLTLYKFHIPEDAPIGSVLLPAGSEHSSVIRATDLDLHSNISYSIEPSTGVTISLPDGSTENVPQMGYQYFDYRSQDQVLITRSQLDREIQALMGFNLCADDGTYTVCTAVVVHIDDVNDNPPRFQRNTYVLRIAENEQHFGSLIEFEVEDRDEEMGELKFEIMPPESSSTDKNQPTAKDIQSAFMIRGNKLYLKSTLDRERFSHYHFFVSVQDRNLKKSDLLQRENYDGSRAEIYIDVSDVNDNQPVFVYPNSTSERGNRLNVSCHENVGNQVGQLEAVDADLGVNGTVIYAILRANDKMFYLDNRTGVIYTSEKLSEKCGTQLQLFVSAQDIGPDKVSRGQRSTIEPMLISIQDQPTLSELQRMNDANLRLHKLDDSEYGFPTKAILSIVLGGSTIFLISLLIIWVVLLTYHKSKRRRNMPPGCPIVARTMTPNSFDPAGHPSYIYGTLSNLKSNQYAVNGEQMGRYFLTKSKAIKLG
ncbi:Protocadherin Fat 4 [Cichlidogyrus casuarinus]|uniref:Protocadherin Fat 4 n=1 Tax=Cichlidogyrus casuarinus TaxID=1844966 RepID=A0ABD2PWV3_9PLAT